MALLSNYLLVIILSLIVIFEAVIFSLVKKNTWKQHAPSIITTTGIASTFIGVSIGLIGFNSNSINGLDYLLEGLKTAFLPSTLAITLAIIFKIYNLKTHAYEYDSLLLEELQKNNRYLGALTKHFIPEFTLTPELQVENKEINLKLKPSKLSDLTVKLNRVLTETQLVIHYKNKIVILLKKTEFSWIILAKLRNNNAKHLLAILTNHKYPLKIIADKLLSSKLFKSIEIGAEIEGELINYLNHTIIKVDNLATNFN